MIKPMPGGVILAHTNPPVQIKGEMSLRDYFAAKALLGFLSYNGGNSLKDHQLAEASYDMADEMLKARNAKKS